MTWQMLGVIIPAALTAVGVWWGRRIESRRSAVDITSVEVGTARSVVEMLRVELDRARAVHAEEIARLVSAHHAQIAELRAEIDRLRAEVDRLSRDVHPGG